jgi:4-aminobutyrate aminotransferase
MANAAMRGEQLRAGLRELAKKHPTLTGVRGMGLMTAADLPSGVHREQVIQGAFQRGLLLLGCGEAALRFCPPLCITAEQVQTCLRILDGVLGAVEPAKAVSASTPTAGPLPVV